MNNSLYMYIPDKKSARENQMLPKLMTKYTYKVVQSCTSIPNHES